MPAKCNVHDATQIFVQHYFCSISAPLVHTHCVPTVTPIACEALLLTQWGRVTHICVSKLTNIGSDNGLSPGRRQAIIWTNAGILLIGPLGTNFNENLIDVHTFSFKKMHLKMSSRRWRPFCLGLNVLTWINFNLNMDKYTAGHG